jgi:hypothetical protein
LENNLLFEVFAGEKSFRSLCIWKYSDIRKNGGNFADFAGIFDAENGPILLILNG